MAKPGKKISDDNAKRGSTNVTSYRFIKHNPLEWELIEIINGKEKSLFKNIHNVVFGQFKRILLNQGYVEKDALND